MTSQTLVDKCREIVPRTRDWGVRALVVGGSIGQGRADENSDLDLFMVVENVRLDEFCTHKVREMAELFGKVLLFRGPVFVPSFGYSFSALLDDHLLVQINLNSPEMLKPNTMGGLGSIIIFDDSGDFKRFVVASEDIHPEPLDLFERSATFFWLRAVLTWRALKRGQVWMAARYLVDLRDQILLLKRLIHNTPPLNPNTPGKSIEHDLGLETLKDLEPTVPDASATSVVCAFRYSLLWYASESANFSKRSRWELDVVCQGSRILSSILDDQSWQQSQDEHNDSVGLKL
jgi:hypothetical protein